MTKRVVILYSQSDHFSRAVEAMQSALPDATLTALLPTGRDDLKNALPERVEVVETPAQALAVIRQLRALDADALCVLYPSPRLRVLAALSGARVRACCGEDGKLRPLDGGLFSVLASLASQRLRGEVRYAWLWLFVRITRAPRP